MIPSTKMIVAPHVIIIPTGSTYTRISYPRPVTVEALDPATAGTIYTNPNTNPPRDATARQSVGGAFLYAKGDWWIRHSAATDQSFRVEDSGGSGATTQSPPSVPPAAPFANRAGWYNAQKTVAVPSTSEQCVAQAIPNGFALTVMALPTNTGNIGIGTTAANSDLATGTPVILGPGAAARLFVTNANLVWVDAIVAGNGVSLSAEV